MRPLNITNAVLLEESGLTLRDPVHIGVVGPGDYSNDGEFVGRIVDAENRVTGVTVMLHGRVISLSWGDLIEFWPLPPILCHSGPRKAYLEDKLRIKLHGEDF